MQCQYYKIWVFTEVKSGLNVLDIWLKERTSSHSDCYSDVLGEKVKEKCHQK